MSCSVCQAPARQIWAIKGYPELPDVFIGNWISLQQCAACQTYWCYSPHDPHTAYVFLTIWPYDAATFRRLNELDQARILHEWQAAFIRENWRHLPPKEKRLVDIWQAGLHRSRNFIDWSRDYPKPKYISQAADISSYVSL